MDPQRACLLKKEMRSYRSAVESRIEGSVKGLTAGWTSSSQHTVNNLFALYFCDIKASWASSRSAEGSSRVEVGAMPRMMRGGSADG